MGKTSTKAKDKYNKKAYDQMLIRPFSGDKAKFQAFLDEQNKRLGTEKSLNQFVLEAIEEKMEREKP
mgnify:FL=1